MQFPGELRIGEQAIVGVFAELDAIQHILPGDGLDMALPGSEQLVPWRFDSAIMDHGTMLILRSQQPAPVDRSWVEEIMARDESEDDRTERREG